MITHAFRSGMSRRNDFKAAASAGVPVGVVAGELHLMQVLFGIPKYVASGGVVFVDTGAFTAFRKGGEPDFPTILGNYRDMVTAVRDFGGDPGNLYLVSPDAVGDQQRTIELLGLHQSTLAKIIRSGAKLIVPIQCGDMPVADMLAAAIAILGTDQFVAGIPSNEAAMTVSQAATLKHHSFHILGRVQRNEQQEARIAALRAQNADAVLTADANWMRSRIPQICAATNAISAERRGATPSWATEASRTTALKRMIQADTAWSN